MVYSVYIYWKKGFVNAYKIAIQQKSIRKDSYNAFIIFYCSLTLILTVWAYVLQYILSELYFNIQINIISINIMIDWFKI